MCIVDSLTDTMEATVGVVNSNTNSVIVGVVVPTVLLLLIVGVAVILSLRRILSKKVKCS